jgi:hypothetical protein
MYRAIDSFWLAVVCTFVSSSGLLAFDGNAWQLASAAYNRGDYHKSLTLLERLRSNDPSVHFLMGMCYKRLGQSDAARRQLQWCSSYADEKVREMAQQELGSLGSRTSSGGHAASKENQPTATSPPRDFINDSASATVNAAARAGWRPCNGGCLTFATSGWHHEKMNGFADSDQWMKYPYTQADGTASWYAYSQRHIGHIIKTFPNKPAEDQGPCPVCKGVGWIR